MKANPPHFYRLGVGILCLVGWLPVCQAQAVKAYSANSAYGILNPSASSAPASV
ncbi:MAG: hypothetical protein H7Z75_10455, partial [Ferruginibacter sp.]|nr:hypothetical protein [Cytophagales bacterium]